MAPSVAATPRSHFAIHTEPSLAACGASISSTPRSPTGVSSTAMLDASDASSGLVDTTTGNPDLHPGRCRGEAAARAGLEHPGLCARSGSEFHRRSVQEPTDYELDDF